MANELRIQIRPGVVAEPEDLLAGFPFEDGQSLVSFTGDMLIVDLGEAEDTNYVQDWYLNSNDDVLSFFVLED